MASGGARPSEKSFYRVALAANQPGKQSTPLKGDLFGKELQPPVDSAAEAADFPLHPNVPSPWWGGRVRPVVEATYFPSKRSSALEGREGAISCGGYRLPLQT